MAGFVAVQTGMYIARSVAGLRAAFAEVGHAGSTAEATVPNKPLAKAGDICQSCRKFWEHRKLPIKRLVEVPKADSTVAHTDHGIPIVICPHCDGDAILKLHKEG